MTWGRETDADDAASQLSAFLDAGGTLLDTADVYNDGESEALIGQLLSEVISRESVILATKAGIAPNGPRPRDTSRGHLLRALDASLARLRTDYIDLWQLQAWDPATSLEETFSAIETALASGRVRYVGVSNFAGWQMTAAALTARLCSRTAVVTNQVEYSLLERSAEAEIAPAARHLGVGLLPWSPLGRGVLTGKYRKGTPADSRGANQDSRPSVGRFLDERSAGIVEAVATAADGLGVSPLAVSLAWVRDRPGVAAPIVGARTVGQLTGSLSTEDLTLPPEIFRALDDVSRPNRY